jgi:hypothetical protein
MQEKCVNLKPFRNTESNAKTQEEIQTIRFLTAVNPVWSMGSAGLSTHISSHMTNHQTYFAIWCLTLVPGSILITCSSPHSAFITSYFYLLTPNYKYKLLNICFLACIHVSM